MTYMYGIITAGVLGLLGWIFSLIQNNKDLKEKVAQALIDGRIKEWADKIKAQDSKITEETRDYEKAKKDFDTKFGTDDGSGKSGE